MPNALRFLFSGNDLQKVVLNSIQVEDIVAGAPAGSPPIASMRLNFRQSDPGPLQIRPLFPGTMRFLVDPAAPGAIPDPATGSFTEADYPGWKTLGRLLIILSDQTAGEIAGMAPMLPVKPNRIWYGPVRLPPGFLFETLTAGLKKAPIPASGGRTIRTSNADWRKFAIAEFLAGRYTPLLVTSANAAQDDRVRFVMPTVEVPNSGDIQLDVTTALAQKPQDALDSEFENPAPPVGQEEPTHPRNGLIPAREVYRRLRPGFVAEPAATALMNAILFDWPEGPLFWPIQFTRTSEATNNCSVHFPRQTVHMLAGPGDSQDQTLPAHGFVYFRQAPPPTGQPAPPAPILQVSLTGNMKWLPGGGTSWRSPGQTAGVAIDFGAIGTPHVSLRLPMSEAMFSDTSRPAPRGARCAYLSMRRTVRALIDNRIAGGRLNFGVNTTSAVTRGIIRRAFQGTPASVNAVAANAPNPAGDPNVLALTLEPMWRAFFPDPAPQQPIPGAPANPTVLDEGEMVYRLWQSIAIAFQSNQTSRNFSDAHIGRGAPGAMVAANLAAFHVDPVRNVGDSDNAYFDRVAGSMLAGLQPGALLQFWNLNSDFEDLKNRSVPGGANPQIASYGHSPVFVDYVLDVTGNVIGITILDQFGESTSAVAGPAGNRRIQWDGDDQQIWIAANWSE
ncbi:MAG TPA: hypothetical protein VFQ79_04360 [Bryobacteraceae bacterium]|nr:hypothetical protein [Bryobacteraceae bacterium]